MPRTTYYGDYEHQEDIEMQKLADEERAKGIEINKLITGTFGTDIGKKCLDHLKEKLVDINMYENGMTIEDVAFRQGRADVVKQIMKEIEHGNR